MEKNLDEIIIWFVVERMMPDIKRIVNSNFGGFKFPANVIEFEDLMQEAYYGAIKAIRTWDHTKNMKLSTWLFMHIITHIRLFIATNAYAFSISDVEYNIQRKIIAVSDLININLKRQLTHDEKQKLKDKLIKFKLSNKDFDRIIKRINTEFLSTVGESTENLKDNKDGSWSAIKTVEDEDFLQKIMVDLNKNENLTIKYRYLTPIIYDYKTIGKFLGVVKFRVWQYEKDALEKIRYRLKLMKWRERYGQVYTA